MVDAGAVHGLIMIVAWLLFAQLGEFISLIASCMAGERTSYFKKMPNGEKWFNAHRFCVSTAVILAFIGWFYILGNGGAEEYGHNRHPMYGTILMALAVIQIAVRLMYPGDESKVYHRWLGRLIVFGAFWCACTGYELANGTDKSDEVNPIYYVFAISYLIRIVLIFVFAVMRRSGWRYVKTEEPSPAVVEVPNQTGATLQA